jgi:sulfopyruvate decarboxylase subunit alpha
MTPANAATVTELLKDAGFDFAVTLPATQVHALQTQLINDPDVKVVQVSNEGEGAAICAGAWLGGKTPFMVIETSGILVATYALLRCHATFGIPTMILSTYRGELGEQEWYAVHTGAAIPSLLGALRIPSRIVSEVDELRTSLVEARRSMDTSLHPVSIIMSGRITKG